MERPINTVFTTNEAVEFIGHLAPSPRTVTHMDVVRALNERIASLEEDLKAAQGIQQSRLDNIVARAIKHLERLPIDDTEARLFWQAIAERAMSILSRLQEGAR